jgi:TIR domain
VKIFVSYTSSDKRWAHWIAWQLQEDGHQPFVHEWEIGAGENIPRWMEERIDEADHLMGVFSDSYCEAIFSRSERWAGYWDDPEGRTGFLIPIEVVKVTKWPRLVSPLNRLSLISLTELTAAERLRAFLEPRKPPTQKPEFPGTISAEPSGSAFTKNSEPLGASPPSFPAASFERQSEGPGILTAADLNPSIRCIEDHEPKPQIFGRDHEIEVIVKAMIEGSTILIAGGPGMGKTAVATAALYDPRIVAHFGRRRVFASLETATEPRAILTKLVESLGLPPTGDEGTLHRILQIKATEQPFACILDNVETVFDTDRSVSERLLNLVAQIDGISLLVTIRGVPPLVPSAIQIDDLPRLKEDAARKAFLSIAGTSFDDDPNLLSLLDILDGHALSIHLVAAQAVGSSSLAGLRESWNEARAEILRISGEEESRLTSVRASLALSMNSNRMRGNPLARRLTTLLALLPSGMPETDAHSFLGERGVVTKAKANEAVVCLHQLRLVEKRPDRRMRMLTPLRECMKTGAPLMDDDKRRIINHYLVLAESANKVGAPDWEQVNAAIQAEADNLDPICGLAVATDISHRRLQGALTGLVNFYMLSGQGEITSLQNAVDRVRVRPQTPFTAACIWLLAEATNARGEHQISRAHFKESLLLYKHFRNLSGEANCLRGLAAIAVDLSDLELGLRLSKEARAL